MEINVISGALYTQDGKKIADVKDPSIMLVDEPYKQRTMEVAENIGKTHSITCQLEYIIPTVPGRRQRGISLWMQAGKTLGMLGPDGEISAHANGGAVGAGSSIIPEDSIQLAQVPEKADNTVWSIMGQAVSNESSKDASEGDGTTFTVNNAQQNDGGGKVEVNVNMNPVIKIEGSNMDEEKIFQVLQNRIREMADDLGDEIAERMGKIFNNMPAVQEA